MTNRRFLKIIFPIFGAVVCFSWMVAASAQAQQPLVIVNDKSNVLHHVAGNALCQLDPQSSCKTVQADGEVGSIEQLLGGKAQLAVVTSESAYQAWMGQLPFKGKQSSLRLVLRLQPEAMALVGRQEAGIAKLKDIFDKRVNIGAPGTLIERLALELLVACEIWPTDLLTTGHEEVGLMPEAFKQDRLDAYFHVMGHPAKVILQTQKATPITLASLDEPCIGTLVKKLPYLRKMVIPKGSYPGITQPVKTFGVDALLLTTDKVPADVILKFTEVALTNIDDFRMRHSAFLPLDRKFLTEPFVVPFHDVVKPLLGR